MESVQRKTFQSRGKRRGTPKGAPRGRYAKDWRSPTRQAQWKLLAFIAQNLTAEQRFSFLAQAVGGAKSRRDISRSSRLDWGLLAKSYQMAVKGRVWPQGRWPYPKISWTPEMRMGERVSPQALRQRFIYALRPESGLLPYWTFVLYYQQQAETLLRLGESISLTIAGQAPPRLQGLYADKAGRPTKPPEWVPRLVRRFVARIEEAGPRRPGIHRGRYALAGSLLGGFLVPPEHLPTSLSEDNQRFCREVSKFIAAAKERQA
jgi:hypothetical protein